MSKRIACVYGSAGAVQVATSAQGVELVATLSEKVVGLTFNSAQARVLANALQEASLSLMSGLQAFGADDPRDP